MHKILIDRYRAVEEKGPSCFLPSLKARYAHAMLKKITLALFAVVLAAVGFAVGRFTASPDIPTGEEILHDYIKGTEDKDRN